MEKTYYIYHIPNFIWKDGSIGKIGVSKKPIGRAASQSNEYEILETHTDIMKVSEREIELQKEYGYKVDKVLYYTMELRSSKRSPTPKAQLHNMRLLALSSKSRVENIRKFNKTKRVLTYTIAEYIRTQYVRKVDIYGKKITMRRLSKIFNVDSVSIFNIINNKTYTQP